MSAVSKSSYLKEFILPKVRVIIYGLFFASEGYNRAKNILINNYGKSSEVAITHIQNIISFLHINSVNFYERHEFTVKLLRRFSGSGDNRTTQRNQRYIRLTLDRLQRLRIDLVRMNNGYQWWKFPKLVEVLESCTQRNPIPLTENKIQKNFKSCHFKVECI